MKLIGKYIFVLFVLVLGIDIVYADGININLVKQSDKEAIIEIESSEIIGGLSGTFKYNNEQFKLVSCESNKGFVVTVKENKIIIDDFENKNGVVATCIFKVTATGGESQVELLDVKTSQDGDLKNYNDLVVNLNETKYNPIINNIGKILLVIVIILLLVIIFVGIYVFLKKRKANLMVVVLGIIGVLLTTSSLSYSGKSDILYNDGIANNIRDFILSSDEFNDSIRDYDFDNDKAITINDLIIERINLSKPSIIFDDVKMIGESKYKTSVERIIKVDYYDRIEEIKYCVTTEKDCVPNIESDFIDDKIVVDFKNNVDSQRVCVLAKDTRGYKSKKCDNKTYLVDSTIPTISVKESTIKVNDEMNYDRKDNVEVSYGVSGGSISCSEYTLKVGNNSIECIATGNNGLTSATAYNIVMTYTYNKVAAFFGDSITEGYHSFPEHKKRYSWANYIGENYDLKESYNLGRSGWKLSDVDNRFLPDSLTDAKKNDYDFVILHGGCNDVAAKVKMGEFDENDFSGKYDESTFVGGLERYLYLATTQWPDARIGFIINYQTPANKERNYEASEPYYEVMRQVLDKWNISYLDLHDGSAPDGRRYSEDILKTGELNKEYAYIEGKTDYRVTGTYGYTHDNLHITYAGYEVISPYIYEWMNTLEKYSSIQK